MPFDATIDGFLDLMGRGRKGPRPIPSLSEPARNRVNLKTLHLTFSPEGDVNRSFKFEDWFNFRNVTTVMLTKTIMLT